MRRPKQMVQVLSHKEGKPLVFNKRPGRNDKCHCGSGEKYKNCHLNKDERTRFGGKDE